VGTELPVTVKPAPAEQLVTVPLAVAEGEGAPAAPGKPVAPNKRGGGG
jgi:hypothetical protein